VFEVTGNDQQKHAFTTAEILHIPALSSDGYFGIDPIRAHVHGLGAVAAADEYAARAFSQGTSMGGYIKMPGRLDDTEADRVRAQWRRLHNGLANAHEFGILGDGATYETIGLDPQQTQLLETRKFGVTEIARILGVVPHKLYDLERSTFSNIEHQAIESVQDSIMPWLIRLETWMNHDRSLGTPSTFHEFVVEGLLRGDTKTRMEAYATAIQGGFMSPRFAATRENFPAPDALEYWQRPLNTAYLTESDPPGGTAEGDTGGGDPLDVVTAAQKVYLAVTAGVITVDEARQMLNDIGADLPGVPS
jgi:HK97 family phage portal protein